MSIPHPNLSSFTNFANTKPQRRETTLRTIREQSASEYSPATDHWKRMRDAVKRDRRTTRDGAAVFAEAANATEKKKNSFSLVATQWGLILPRWNDSSFEPVSTGVAELNGLDVSVVPRFIEAWDHGHKERTVVYFNATPLSPITIDVALRLIQRAFPQDETTVPALVDVRRGRVHNALSQSPDKIDDLIASLAEEFTSQWAAA